MRSPLLTRFLLIVALLFAQTGGLVHGISHTLTEQSQGSDQSLPHNQHCDLCAAYAQIGSAIGSSSIGIASSENLEAPYFSYPGSYTSSTFVAFAARAPPYSA
jgi:hypothetical protein